MPDRLRVALESIAAVDWLRVLGLALQLVGLVASLRRRRILQGRNPHKN